MKLILLNPHIDAAHAICQALEAKGVAILYPADAKEAWQILQLHGTSIDLAVIHREQLQGSKKDAGQGLVSQIKKSAGQPNDQADLPIIMTSDSWGDAEFTAHQATPDGVNAYLHWPFSEAQLKEMIEAILGVSLSGSKKAAALQQKPKKSKPSPAPAAKKAFVPFDGPAGGAILQDVSEIFKEPTPAATGFSGIHLDAPDAELLPPEPPQEASPLLPPEGEPEESESPPIEMPSSDLSLSSLMVEGSSLQLTPAEEPPPPASSDSMADLMKNLGAVAPPPPEPEAQPESSPSSASLELSMSSLLAPAESPSPSAEATEPTPSFTFGADAPSPQAAESSLLFGKEPASPQPGESPSFSFGKDSPAQATEEDLEAVQEMPYIFGNKKLGSAGSSPKQTSIFAEAMGDAIIPGGASHTPDLETIKKYLLLREQDVAVLSTQLKATQGQVQLMEQMLREERAKSAELTHVANEQKQKIDDFEKDKLKLIGKFETEMQELNFQMKAKVDKARIFESQIEESSEEMEHLKERVRSDIRKIRVREKELENRLEIMKKDSEALMGARESKIIELKRKLDLLEFNMDLLQDQYTREKEKTALLRERLNKAAQIVRVAGGLLDAPKPSTEGLSSGEGAADSDLTASVSSDLSGSSTRQAS